jgi:carbon-monoxide dehydrogenase large subunit
MWWTTGTEAAAVRQERTDDEMTAERFTGTSVRRLEDPRLLTGRGRYVDDITAPDMVHAAFVRSPLAHARVVKVDACAAQAAPGVLAVYTGADMEALIEPGPYGMAEMMRIWPPAHSLLATDKVRLVGDLVALVIAESRALAEDAVDLVEVDYEPLPVVMTAAQALDPLSPPIFEDLPSNVLVGPKVNHYGDVDGVFARADRVLHVNIAQHRHQNVPMETRGTVVRSDPESGEVEIWSSTQGLAVVAKVLAARLGIPPEKVRARAGDVGGSFGLKIGCQREDVAIAAACRQVGRPVKWIEDRNEHLLAAGHAREETFEVQAAISNDGDIQGLKVKMVMDIGAYPGVAVYTAKEIEDFIPGPYRIEALSFETTVVLTNKATYVPYRGPWAAETFVRERVVNLVAEALGKDPLEIRLRNVARREADRSMITGPSLAGITTRESLERVSERVDQNAFRARQKSARAEGRYLGVGIACYIEAAPGVRRDAPLGSEEMRMELAEDGTVLMYTGQVPHGQGHQTTLAQVAADTLGVGIEAVRVVYGDTAVTPAGLTGGSRGATMAGGAALVTARAFRNRVLDVASHLLEASRDDLRIEDGSVYVAGVPARGMSLAEVACAVRDAARIPAGVDAELAVAQVYDGGAGGWSGGTHCAVVEVDVDTGLVHVLQYLVVEDCGEIINPAIVDGQIRGGVAQGIGAVLLEQSAYDADGNYLSATFMDYPLPTTMDVPIIDVEHLEPVPLDPQVNFRGVGEGGMIVTPATVVNAIEDALLPFGVRISEQHLPPWRILELIGRVVPA